MRPLTYLALCGAAVALLAGKAPSALGQQQLTSGPGAKQTSINFARNVAAGPGGEVQVIWFDDRSGVSQIYTKRSPDGGITWSPDLQAIETNAPVWVAEGGDPAQLQALLQQFQGLMTTWTYSWEIYLKRSDDGGATWGPDVRLTYAPGPSMRPSIAAAGRKVNLVWCDGRDGESEVYFKRSADGGATWGPDVRLTTSAGNPLGDSMHPSLATGADGTAYVVWTDRRGGNPEIYFQRLAPQ